MPKTAPDTALPDQARTAIDIVTSALQDAVRQELDALRTSVQTHLVALDRVLSHEHMQPAFEPIVEQLCAAIAQETAAMRGDLETRLARSQASAAAEETKTREAIENLDAARLRIDALERAQTDVALERDIAEAHLEGETHNRAALTAELEAARAQVLQARADANAQRLKLQRIAERVGELERTGPPAGRANADPPGAAMAALEQVRAAMQTLTKASNAQHLLAASIELLADHFARVAFLASGPQGVTVWRSRGFERPLQNRAVTIPGVDESPVARALASGEASTMDAAAGGTFPGLSGGTAAFAIALPVLATDQQTMILYAENPPGWSKGSPAAAQQIAGIVADHLTYRLRKKQTAADAQVAPHAPLRRARRLKLREGTTVGVDGAESALVDVSFVGAQVLTTRAIKPNRAVHLLLPTDAGGLPCEARVVWAVVESNGDQKKARYRAGVQFTEVDPSQLEAFFARYGFSKNDIHH